MISRVRAVPGRSHNVFVDTTSTSRYLFTLYRGDVFVVLKTLVGDRFHGMQWCFVLSVHGAGWTFMNVNEALL